MTDSQGETKFDALLGKMLKLKPLSKQQISERIAAEKAAKKIPTNGKPNR
jgi:hypothetical protein